MEQEVLDEEVALQGGVWLGYTLAGEKQNPDSTIWNAKELERYGEPPESDPSAFPTIYKRQRTEESLRVERLDPRVPPRYR